METLTLVLFCILFLICLTLDLSIIYALLAGLILFIAYGLKRGFSPTQIGKMCLSGIRTAGNVLLAFVLIGLLTALWRASGTIAVIICYFRPLILPSLLLPMAFLLNCALSFLTGTAFGTAATMGVICAAMGTAIGTPPILLGGAILSGSFFGDRCSPSSSSALLVAELTHTSIFDNMRGMVKTAAIPFAASLLLYLLIGFFLPHSDNLPDLTAMFDAEFKLHWVALLPAAVIILLALFRVGVKTILLSSIIVAVPICFFVQGCSLAELASISVLGFSAQDSQLAAMLDGGGILSMARVSAIICIASAYSGIFQGTGLLNKLQADLMRFAERTAPYCACLLTAVAAAAVSCNQTLAIMLTDQLCCDMGQDKHELALDISDSAVIASALIPWSIAAAVPLESVGAPSSAILFAFFLYLLPVWRLLQTALKRKRPLSKGAQA